MRARRAAPLLLLAVLAGCGTATTPSAPATPTVSHTKGLPPSVTITDTSGQSVVGWLGAGQMYLVTYGSSTCPRLPTSVTAAAGNRLTITTARSSDGPCTMDLGPTTSVVDVPRASPTRSRSR